VMSKRFTPRYGGRLLDAVRDGLGLIEVVERGDIRSLHFGNSIEQSSYVPDAPDWLQFGYYRKLMFATALHINPVRVLLLGLGAGVIARYLLSHLHPLRLTAVEYREAVADMAYSYFGLPQDSRLDVYIATAGQFLEEFEREWDVIIVDLYDAEGLNEEPRQRRFLDACCNRLAAHGVVAINLWRSDPDEYVFMLRQLRQVFADRILLADADDANTVAYCFHDEVPDLASELLLARIRERAAVLNFDGSDFLDRIHHPDGRQKN